MLPEILLIFLFIFVNHGVHCKDIQNVPFGEAATEERILNGVEATAKKYPYMVTIEQNLWFFKNNYCGGVILTPSWILSAAHCFVKKDGSLVQGGHYIHAGEISKSTYKFPNTQLVRIHAKYVHPKYATKPNVNDIALLLLSNTLQFNEFVQPITLPAWDYKASGAGVILGWGAMDYDEKRFPDTLIEANITVSDMEKCKEFQFEGFPVLFFLTDSQLCLGLDTITNACSGDSGGPFIQIINKKPTVVGVTSFGLAKCDQREPIIYTNVAKYISFLHSVMFFVDIPKVPTTLESVMNLIKNELNDVYHFVTG